MKQSFDVQSSEAESVAGSSGEQLSSSATCKVRSFKSKIPMKRMHASSTSKQL